MAGGDGQRRALGYAVATFVPSTGAQNEQVQEQLADGSDQVRGILNELQPPTLDAMQIRADERRRPGA